MGGRTSKQHGAPSNDVILSTQDNDKVDYQNQRGVYLRLCTTDCTFLRNKILSLNICPQATQHHCSVSVPSIFALTRHRKSHCHHYSSSNDDLQQQNNMDVSSIALVVLLGSLGSGTILHHPTKMASILTTNFVSINISLFLFRV